MTPEPALTCGSRFSGISKKRRKKGSRNRGLSSRFDLVKTEILTTAGVTSVSNGANDGIGALPTATGNAASAMTGLRASIHALP